MENKPEFSHQIHRKRRIVPIPQPRTEVKEATSEEIKNDETPHLERSSRHEPKHSVEKYKRLLYYLPFFLVALVVSFIFYSFPFSTQLPTGQTAQNLYIGFAMNHGVMPYNTIYASDGPLFYLLNQLGYFGGQTAFLWLIEVLLLFASGSVAYKILQTSTRNHRLSSVSAAFAQIAIAGLSLGGTSSFEFAMPFALYGIYVLNNYFMDDEKQPDEIFILYGMAGGIATLIAPAFLTIWIIGFFSLLVYNIYIRLFARGLYQFLATTFGFLVIAALIGYITLTKQIFFSALTQAFVIPFTTFHFGLTGLMNFGLSLILLLLFGLISSWVIGFQYMTFSSHRVWAGTLAGSAIIILFLMSFRRDFTLSDVLIIFPLVFMFSGLRAVANLERRPLSGIGLVASYLKTNLTLPIFGMIFMIVFPYVTTVVHSDLLSSERAAAAYISKNTKSSDQVFVLGDGANISLLSKRVSPLELPPSYYAKSYQETFDTTITMTKASYIVVEKGNTLPKSLKTVLSEAYKPTAFKDGNFAIYKKTK